MKDIDDEENVISNEEFQMLEERWERYKENPSSAISFNEFDAQLKEKYGK